MPPQDLLPLKGLAAEYNLVFVDGNVVSPSNMTLQQARNFRKELTDCVTSAGNIVMTAECFKEQATNHAFNAYIPGSLEVIEPFGRELITLQRGAIAFILPEAKKKGVYDPQKKYPLADVEFAATVIVYAMRPTRIASVSADRKLNDLIADILGPLRKGDYSSGFPFVVKGSVDVYTFIQEKGRCKLFST